MAQGGTYEGAADLATASTSLVVDRIQRFDLRHIHRGPGGGRAGWGSDEISGPS